MSVTTRLNADMTSNRWPKFKAFLQHLQNLLSFDAVQNPFIFTSFQNHERSQTKTQSLQKFHNALVSEMFFISCNVQYWQTALAQYALCRSSSEIFLGQFDIGKMWFAKEFKFL